MVIVIIPSLEMIPTTIKCPTIWAFTQPTQSRTCLDHKSFYPHARKTNVEEKLNDEEEVERKLSTTAYSCLSIPDISHLVDL